MASNPFSIRKSWQLLWVRERASCGLSVIPGSEIAFHQAPDQKKHSSSSRTGDIFVFSRGLFIYIFHFSSLCTATVASYTSSSVAARFDFPSALCPNHQEVRSVVAWRNGTWTLKIFKLTRGVTPISTQCPGKSLISYHRSVPALATRYSSIYEYSYLLPVPSFVHYIYRSARTNYWYEAFYFAFITHEARMIF